MQLPDWFSLFQDPPAKYRTMPQWSWNGEMTEQRIREQLDQFAAQGCGGLFPHARPGHITGYITDRWFELWDYACRYARKLGIEFHIYDEFMAPGGNAGGVVVQRHPELAERKTLVQKVYSPQQVQGSSVLACFRETKSGQVPRRMDVEAWKEASPENPVLVLTMDPPQLGRTFAAADLLQQETAKVFLETTHDRYAQYSGDEFGKTVRFMFCDEPHVTAGFWPMSRYFLKEFKFEHGYDLIEKVDKLIFTREGSQEVRYDYFQTSNRLFIDNFMKPLYHWCDENDLLFTGHLIENAFPRPKPHPDNMAALRWMHAPGNDLLGFQFSATTPEDNALYFYNLREMTSVANQMGCLWRLVESAGAPGYQTSFDLFKPCEDYLLALGTNVMDPHLGHQSLSGIRKYDWPHTLSDHSPWWQYYHHQANHVGRANAALCQGKEINRVAVLHPATSTWLHWESPLGQTKGTKLPQPDKIVDVGKSMFDLVLQLYANQVDFDLVSELVLAELGQVRDGKLQVGQCTYDLVVMPDCMENWITPTLETMEHYLASGGSLLALGEPPIRVDGRINQQPNDLQQRQSDHWKQLDSTAALVDEIRRTLEPRLCAPDGSALPGRLCWRRVDCDDGHVVYFFANPWPETLTAQVRLVGHSALELDTADGSATALALEACENGLALELELPSRGHRLIVTSPEASPAQPEQPLQVQEAPVEIELACAEATDVNRVLIDYCNVRSLTGEELLGAPTAVADQTNWRWQGYAANPWRKQIARNVADRQVDPNTGFIVSYTFTVESDVPEKDLEKVELAIERPWLYELRLNGQPLDAGSARRWFDEDMRAVPTAGLVRSGENELSLKAQPFDTLCEIMPIYILGPVAALPAEKGFVVGKAQPLGHGDWTRQGYAFYPAGVRYDYTFELSEHVDGLTVQLNNWGGSVVVVHWQGESAGEILHPPFSLEIDQPVPAGSHSLGIEVLGNVRNMMGPHFGTGLTGPWAYEAYPMTQPEGNEYKLIATGLFEPPTVSTRTKS